MAESWVFSSLITASYSTYTQARTLVKMTGSWSQDRYSLSCYNGSVTYIQLVPYCTSARTMMKCEQQAPNANDHGSRKLENTPETREMVVKPIISRRQVNQHQQHQGQTLACMNQATRYSGIQFNPVHSTLLHGRFTFDLYSNVQARLRLVSKTRQQSTQQERVWIWRCACVWYNQTNSVCTKKVTCMYIALFAITTSSAKHDCSWPFYDALPQYLRSVHMGHEQKPRGVGSAAGMALVRRVWPLATSAFSMGSRRHSHPPFAASVM